MEIIAEVNDGKKNANDQNGLGCQVQFARDKSEKTGVTAAPPLPQIGATLLTD